MRECEVSGVTQIDDKGWLSRVGRRRRQAYRRLTVSLLITTSPCHALSSRFDSPDRRRPLYMSRLIKPETDTQRRLEGTPMRGDSFMQAALIEREAGVPIAHSCDTDTPFPIAAAAASSMSSIAVAPEQ